MSRKRAWSIDQLREAVANSTTLSDTLRKLGISEIGGNRDVVKHHIRKENIDISHFNRHFPNPRPIKQAMNLEQALSKDTRIPTHSLRMRLLKHGIKQHMCEKCNLCVWFDKPIPLELHHVDGDKYNNTIENLQLLCPNCHALTDNYKGKNVKLK